MKILKTNHLVYFKTLNNQKSIMAQSEDQTSVKKHSVFSHHHWFDRLGLHMKDIPRALIYTKEISWGLYLLTIPLCYRYKPLTRFAKTNYGKNTISTIKNRFPTMYDKTKNLIKIGETKMANSKYINWIPRYLGLKSKRFASAVVQATLLYKFSFPILFPLEVLLAVKMVKYHNSNIQ